ncbi:thiol:disulfide interchange protein DsbA [Nitrosomonas sp. Nm84]|uniref:thiol:disulfide interchange protein DsbA/DsbL n=1 Tax=Nitrosomonas sp. Nm84 TaxID=200124 RepID=UPI000D775E30|nr:thiol:disulfide interchange protein DsbA/DsbL [Nitrosomonas sp. Nm84]PXW89652.1 thiol:disulfide interchange protein DsbA [Nitrosomonas sp. Nm84]
MNYRQSLVVFFLLLSFGLINSLSARADIVEGKDYTVLTNPQPTQDANKIEVLEFFWYGCPHCYSLHPHLKTWLLNIPGDVSFRYVPAILRPNWVAAAKIYYAIEAMGIADVLHDKAYDAIHRDKIDLNNESVLFDWIEKQGIDRKKFETTYKSFGIQNQVARSTQMTRQYQLNGVPALVVNGKYLTSGRMGGTPQDTIKTLELLIEKARKEK